MNTQDILLIVLAFCALWFTAFVCWLIYQIAMILKNVNDTVTDLREKVGKMEEALTGIRNRFEKATSGMNIFVEGAKKVAEFAMEKKREKQERPTKSFDEDPL